MMIMKRLFKISLMKNIILHEEICFISLVFRNSLFDFVKNQTNYKSFKTQRRSSERPQKTYRH